MYTMMRLRGTAWLMMHSISPLYLKPRKVMIMSRRLSSHLKVRRNTPVLRAGTNQQVRRDITTRLGS